MSPNEIKPLAFLVCYGGYDRVARHIPADRDVLSGTIFTIHSKRGGDAGMA